VSLRRTLAAFALKFGKNVSAPFFDDFSTNSREKIQVSNQEHRLLVYLSDILASLARQPEEENRERIGSEIRRMAANPAVKCSIIDHLRADRRERLEK
jgi:hypothetical protein